MVSLSLVLYFSCLCAWADLLYTSYMKIVHLQQSRVYYWDAQPLSLALDPAGQRTKDHSSMVAGMVVRVVSDTLETEGLYRPICRNNLLNGCMISYLFRRLNLSDLNITSLDDFRYRPIAKSRQAASNETGNAASAEFKDLLAFGRACIRSLSDSRNPLIAKYIDSRWFVDSTQKRPKRVE